MENITMTDAFDSTEDNDELNLALEQEEFEYPNPADDHNEIQGVTTQKSHKEDEREEFDDRENFGRKVEKRINKMHAKHQIELTAQNARIQALEAELAEARQQRQQEAKQKNETDFATKSEELKALKIDALDRADHEEVARLDEEIFELKIQARTATQQTNNIEIKPEDRTHRPAPTADNRPQALLDWEAENQWVYDPKHADRKERTNTILKSLYDQGYTADDPDTWEELNRKLARVKPPAPAGVDRGSVILSDSQDAGAGKLTRADIQTMIGLGLDPDDVNHRVRFAKQRSSR
jgi:hypothetical protein